METTQTDLNAQPIIGYVTHYAWTDPNGTQRAGFHERDTRADALDAAYGCERYGYTVEVHERFRRWDAIDGMWVDDRRTIYVA